MPRKVNDEKENLKTNLEYIGLKLERIPKFLKEFEAPKFRAPKAYNAEKYRVYRYIDMSEIEIRPYVLVVTIISIIATFLVQMFTDSMIFGALAGVLVFFISRAYKWTELDQKFVDGIKIMSFIGVVILSANGFAGVMNETGDIGNLVSGLSDVIGENKLFSIIDVATDKLALVSDKAIDTISSFISRIFSKKKRKEDENYE